MSINFADYFVPVSLKKPEITYLPGSKTFSSSITVHTPSQAIGDISTYDAAIIGVPEGRDTINADTAKAPDIIRSYLYQLARVTGAKKIVDLGNFKITNHIQDSYMGLRDVLADLFSKNIVVIMLGGSHALSCTAYLAAKFLNRKMSIAHLDAKIDMDAVVDRKPHADNHLRFILDDDTENRIFTLSPLGYQSHFTNVEDVIALTERNFPIARLGHLHHKIELAEPYIRDLSQLSVDMNCVRQGDAPANKRPSPNGFSGEEVCQMSKYAGMGDAMQFFGIFEANPTFDNNNQTMHLAAQMVWHFIDGMAQRFNEKNDMSSFEKIIVDNTAVPGNNIIFYKSPLTHRWWMEIPGQTSKFIIACSTDDYETACQNEIPDRWWVYYKNINKM